MVDESVRAAPAHRKPIRGRIWFVYCLTCIATGLKYFGLTSNPDERFHQHRFKKSGAPKVRAAIKQYGFEAFDCEIVAWFHTKPECMAHEKRMIAEHNTIWPNGLNLVGRGRGTLKPNMSEERLRAVTENSRRFWAKEENRAAHREAMAKSEIFAESQKRNGERIREWGRIPENREKNRLARMGRPVSEEARRRMSLAKKGVKPTLTDEQRAAMSERQRGRKASDETKRKMSEAARGRTLSAEARAKISKANKGRKHSAEARERMGAAKRGRKKSAELKEKDRLAALTRWSDPVYVEKHRIAALGKQHSSETREKLSKIRSAWWATKKTGRANGEDG